MENKNFKWNIVLLVVILILLIVVIWLVARKTNAPVVNNNENLTPQQINQNVPQSTTTENKQIEWTKSPKFGLYYPSTFKVNEYYYLTPAQSDQGVPETQGVPQFNAINGNAVISWGGAQSGCSSAEFGIFQYGVSTTACVKGMRAQIGLENVRNSLTSQEIKLFGDFVMKNS